MGPNILIVLIPFNSWSLTYVLFKLIIETDVHEKTYNKEAWLG